MKGNDIAKLDSNAVIGSGRGYHTDIIGALNCVLNMTNGVDKKTHCSIPIFDGKDRDRLINAVKALAIDLVESVERSYVPEKKSFDVKIKSSSTMTYSLVANDRDDAIEQALKMARDAGDENPKVVECEEVY